MGPGNSQMPLLLAFPGPFNEFWASAEPRYGVGMNVNPSQRMEKGSEQPVSDNSWEQSVRTYQVT